MKECAKCYWHDQCGQGKLCKFYDPLNSFELAAEEYRKDLRKREKAYQYILDEFGVDPLEEAITEIERHREV